MTTAAAKIICGACSWAECPLLKACAAAIERAGGLHFARDPLARRVRFDAATGLMRQFETKAQAVGGSKRTSKVTRAAVRQGLWQYVDAVGGAA